ncbi:MAG: acyloxyacyl hydrolase, partial [Bacteroidales bacterium]|nr:acyloxyacyl hydrolase [Bacteroidales bacterium]
MKYLIAFTLILSMGTSGFAQKYRNSGLFFETQITQGGVLKSNDFVRGDNKKGRPINNYSASDIRIGWQTRGSQAWQHAHKLPYYGICIHSMVFSNAEEIGYPAALYFFFGAPFARKAKSSFDYEFSFGLSHNWEPFDDLDNPFNLAIGSYRNAYIDGKVKYVWYFSKKVSMDVGVRVTHFSNGAMRMPNAGINLFAPFVGLRYDLIAKDPIPIDQIERREVEAIEEFNIYLASGKRA